MQIISVHGIRAAFEPHFIGVAARLEDKVYSPRILLSMLLSPGNPADHSQKQQGRSLLGSLVKP